jgi:hypothetical protein
MIGVGDWALAAVMMIVTEHIRLQKKNRVVSFI